MLSLLSVAAFAVCPHSVVQYDVAAWPHREVSTAAVLRDTACRDLPDVDAWNRVLDEACLHRARMRDGRLHLDEAVREGGRCTARSASVSLVASETALAAGRYTISELRLPFVLLRGLGPQIAPWNPGLDHEDWPDVFLPKDHPTVGEVLDLVYPEGWEIVAARHVNTRVQPLGTTRRDVEQGPYLDDALRHSLSEVYRQRLQGEVTLVDMRGRVSKIMEMLEARASKGHASAPGQQVEPR